MPRRLTRTEQSKADYEYFFETCPGQKNPTDPNTIEKCAFLLRLAGYPENEARSAQLHRRAGGMQNARKSGHDWSKP